MGVLTRLGLNMKHAQLLSVAVLTVGFFSTAEEKHTELVTIICFCCWTQQAHVQWFPLQTLH